MKSDNAFYVVKIGSLTQYKFAWAEAVDQEMSDAPCCPKCGRCIGMLRWEPPFTVWLKQARTIGDLTICIGGADFLATRRFVDAALDDSIVGIAREIPVDVVKVGSRGKPPGPEVPELFGVDVVHSSMRVDYMASQVRWDERPAEDYCHVCGPGGGGCGGILKSISSVVIEPGTWDGSDLFFPINMNGTLFLSERGRHFFEKHRFTNCTIIPCRDWSLNFG